MKEVFDPEEDRSIVFIADGVTDRRYIMEIENFGSFKNRCQNIMQSLSAEYCQLFSAMLEEAESFLLEVQLMPYYEQLKRILDKFFEAPKLSAA
ncbi:MAG: hypothetical protein K0S20_183 [Patescibacteria group bacterium]|nr:hypothetical protein [Patescibacteria group bacterium]